MKKEILYQEIARTIACQIKKGVWKAGEKLPSLRTILSVFITIEQPKLIRNIRV